VTGGKVLVGLLLICFAAPFGITLGVCSHSEMKRTRLRLAAVYLICPLVIFGAWLGWQGSRKTTLVDSAVRGSVLEASLTPNLSSDYLVTLAFGNGIPASSSFYAAWQLEEAGHLVKSGDSRSSVYIHNSDGSQLQLLEVLPLKRGDTYKISIRTDLSPQLRNIHPRILIDLNDMWSEEQAYLGSVLVLICMIGLVASFYLLFRGPYDREGVMV
jgi:hypothetical protein